MSIPAQRSPGEDSPVGRQIWKIAYAVIAERFEQERRWGPQNVFDVQPGSDGTHQVGQSYRAMAKILKHQCDSARAAGSESLDLILLEEVFEALEIAVEIQHARDIDRDLLRQSLIEELVQVAAVAEKWVAITERDEPRHG